MRTYRFYTPSLEVGRVSLDPQQANHARRTLRLRPGDAVEVFDGAGGVGTGAVADGGRGVAVDVEAVRRVERARPLVEVATVIPKGHRGDTLVEKLSELGADRLIPLLTARSVGKPRANKMGRFGRIAVEAAKQCGRAWLMEITTPVSFHELLADTRQQTKLLAEGPRVEQRMRSGEVHRGLIDLPETTEEVLVLVGPEGGWNADERAAAEGTGCAYWELGPTVLRVETAAIAAVALLRAAAPRPAEEA